MFYAACEGGSLAMVQLLVDSDHEIDTESASVDQNMTPIFTEVCRDHVDVVRWLLERQIGGSPAEVAAGMFCPLQVAAERGSVEIVRLLLNSPEVDVNAGRDTLTAFELACKGGHVEIADLLAADARVDTTLRPLAVAGAIAGFNPRARMLVERYHQPQTA